MGQVIETLRRDLRRYYQFETGERPPRLAARVRVILDTPGLHAVLVYRFGAWVRREVRPAVFRVPLRVVHGVLRKACSILYGIEIDAKAEIGPGFYVAHRGGIIIGPARIGADCNVAHNVTIGMRSDGRRGVPTLGDRVWVGTGSVLFGPVTVGDGATVGPLTVVSRSVPPRTMVMGNPMRVVQADYDNSAEIDGAPAVTALRPEPRPSAASAAGGCDPA